METNMEGNMKTLSSIQFILLTATLSCSCVFAQTTTNSNTMPSTSIISDTTTPISTNDAALLADLINKLTHDTTLASFNIIVPSITQGIVTLSGTVSTQMQADAAVQVTKSVLGVKNVISTISVRSSASTDSSTTTTITPMNTT